MRHPALSRFLAAILAVVSALTLLSGGICIKKAVDSREQQNRELSLLAGRMEEAAALRAEIDAMADECEGLDAEYDERSWQHAKDMLSYRKDLAMYTATEAGLKTGAEQLEEGYKGLRMGWIQHDNALKLLEEGEKQFQPGYEQYLAGKKQLEEGFEQLRQAEQLKETLPDTAMLRTGLRAVESRSDGISAALSGISGTLQNPPRDPETGEIDDAAFRARLGPQVAALSLQLAAVREVMLASYSAEELDAALQPAAAALASLSAEIADGSRSAEEIIASANSLLAPVSQLPGSVSAIIAAADQTLDMLDDLPAMRARLEAADAALKEGEPALLAAKAKIDEGKKQLAKAKDILVYTEAQLIKGKKSLEEKQAEQDETRVELDRRKGELESEQRALTELHGRVEGYAERKDRFSNLRFALLADEGVSSRVRAGGELLPAAEEEYEARMAASERELAQRLCAAILMILSAGAAVFAVTAAFRDRPGRPLLLPAGLAFAAAAAAEGVSLYAGRDLIYTALFTAIFALALALLNLKKA